MSSGGTPVLRNPMPVKDEQAEAGIEETNRIIAETAKLLGELGPLS